MPKLVSVVIPAYNEERSIPELGRRIQNAIKKLPYLFEIIIVENGSIDKTLDALLTIRKKDKRFKIISLAKNAGCDNGIIAGMKYAKGEAIIIMMADLQEPPELIKTFLTKWEKGYDIVYAVVKKRESLHLVRRLEIFIFYKVMDFLSNGVIIENSSDFRLIDKKVRDIIVNLPEHGKFFRGVVMWTGFKRIGIPFNRAPRFAGESKANFLTVFSIALNALFGFSKAPQHAQTFLLISTFLLAVGAIFFKEYILQIVVAVLVITNLAIFIQNQYIVRIFEESRNRPQFLVNKTFGVFE